MSETTYTVITVQGAHIPSTYKGLIYSKWLRSHRYGNELIKVMDSNAYYDKYSTYISSLLAQPESMVRLAVLTDDHDVVLGFAVHRGPILDYIYVHRDHRTLGIGKKLLPPGIKTVTHLTKDGDKIWKKKYKDWTFNPFA